MSRHTLDRYNPFTNIVFGSDNALESFIQVYDTRFAGTEFDETGEGYLYDRDEMFGEGINLIQLQKGEEKDPNKINSRVETYLRKIKVI